MNFSLTEIGTVFLILFAVIDIVGSIPLILKVKKETGDVSALRASIVAFTVMIVVLFLGESILKLIGIDVYSFSVAGSFVLFFLALEMILSIKLFRQDGATGKTASVVPIAFPIIAGAGTMTSILSLRAEFETVNIVIAIVLNIIPVFIVLKLTAKIERFLGKGGIMVLEKVFGIVLMAIAVKLFSTNAKYLFG